jgi:hypothetical protein
VTRPFREVVACAMENVVAATNKRKHEKAFTD